MDVSVIVPTLNEERNVVSLLENLNRQNPSQILVADGGSEDNTVDLAKSMGADVVISAPGRGVQLNSGAAKAVGDCLFFVHSDVRLPENAISSITQCLSSKTCCGGAFSIDTDSRRPSFRFIYHVINLRSRYLRLPLGDQGIFVTKAAFEALDGYRHIPIMEDLDFIKRLNKIGRITILPQKIIASARRYDRDGPFYGTLRNWGMMLLFLGGADPARLQRYYPHIR